MKALYAIFVGYPNWQREWSWHHPIASLLIGVTALGIVLIASKITNR